MGHILVLTKTFIIASRGEESTIMRFFMHIEKVRVAKKFIKYLMINIWEEGGGIHIPQSFRPMSF